MESVKTKEVIKEKQRKRLYTCWRLVSIISLILSGIILPGYVWFGLNIDYRQGNFDGLPLDIVLYISSLLIGGILGLVCLLLLKRKMQSNHGNKQEQT